MMRRTTLIGASVALVASCAGVAPATPPAPTSTSPTPQSLKSELLARGAIGQFAIRDQDAGLLLTGEKPTDLALVKATLVAGGTTGWHGHAGPSIVVVTKGSVTDRTRFPARRRRTPRRAGFRDDVVREVAALVADLADQVPLAFA